MVEGTQLGETNPVYGPFFGVMGAAAAIIFSCKYNTQKILILPLVNIDLCVRWQIFFAKQTAKTRTQQFQHVSSQIGYVFYAISFI